MPTSLRIAPAFHWGAIETPMGVVGVVAGEGGAVRRIVLPCPSADDLRGRLAIALAELNRPARRATRPEESDASDAGSWPGSWASGVDLTDYPGPDSPWTREASRQIAEYFEGKRRAFDFAYDLTGVSGFHRDALEAAAQIPFGQTRSYWWVAVRAGNPRASRAVGRAMASNPLPLALPCHRVVRSDGSLGGFGGGGPEQKRRLLDHELSMLGPDERLFAENARE